MCSNLFFILVRSDGHLVEANARSFGTDIAFTNPVATVDDCAAQCRNMPSCAAFVWATSVAATPQNLSCWLQNPATPRVAGNTNFFAGTRNAGLLPGLWSLCVDWAGSTPNPSFVQVASSFRVHVGESDLSLSLFLLLLSLSFFSPPFSHHLISLSLSLILLH